MKVLQTFELLNSEIKTAFRKTFFIRKPRLINAPSQKKTCEIKKRRTKKCYIELCISKIDKEAMCKFQFARFVLRRMGKVIVCHFTSTSLQKT